MAEEEAEARCTVRQERFGALDVGSNSVRMLVVERQGRSLRYVDSSAEITRLTQGWGTGEKRDLLPEALERTAREVGAVRRRLDFLEVPEAQRVCFATESLRGARNASAARDVLERAAGGTLRVLSGDEEGNYGFRGARMALPEARGMFDLGGGSLELCSEERAVSLPLGAVRMAGQFSEDEGPLRAHVEAMLEGMNWTAFSPLVGVGGSSSTVAMILEGVEVEAYTPAAVHGRKIFLEELRGLRRRLGALSLEERRRVRGMPGARADILPSGMMVMEILLEKAPCPWYVHSECDLLWGVLGEQAGKDGWRAVL